MLFSVYTLGCKLNQLETEAVTDAFRREGFSLVPWNPGERQSGEPVVMIINTCTVTSTADQKARRIIRKALREYPEACVIVTGCYAQMEAAALAALEREISPEFPDAETGPLPGERQARRLFIVPGEDKSRLLDLPAFLSGAGILPGAGEPAFPASPAFADIVASWFNSPALSREGDGGAFRFRPVVFSTHSRGFLKIQDGCDHRCAYCRVSLARGKSRSLGAAEVLAELQSLEARGFSEAVLTGVNITQYRDTGGAASGSETRLPALLDFLLAGTAKIRLRLSSIEPQGLTDDFYSVLENPRIRPHFHLSVQSGSSAILARMGRPYGAEDIERAAARLRTVKKDPFLAADIIAGFPGETEAEFEKTLSLCGRAGFAWIHAFPFSPRPGTAAFDFSGKVDERDAAARVEALTALARKGRREYVRRWEGKEVELIAEQGTRRGFVPGVSENYLKLLVACGENQNPPAPGALLRCRILPETGPENGDEKRNLPRGIDAFAERIFP